MRGGHSYRILRANTLLFLAAVVWGCTFVAQRAGMDHLGPLGFTGLRFTLGALCLLPLAWLRRRVPPPDFLSAGKWTWLWGGGLAGVIMFAGINLQQIGLVQTTAGNGGFITGLYVVIVPLMGLLWASRPGLGVWTGAVLGAVGLYLLSVTKGFRLTPGDGWVLACAFVWAIHVWILGWLSPRMDSCVLAFGQAAVCAVLSWIAALLWEEMTWAGVVAAWLPLLWGGFMSVAVGFTLQVMGQKDSPPAHAAIILSLESVVAAVSGRLLLQESMTSRALLGAGLMLAGMLIAQLWAVYRPGEVKRERGGRAAGEEKAAA
ncbi:MAG: DMT family transporter [Thermodesulfobacteriota bacterium]